MLNEKSLIEKLRLDDINAFKKIYETFWDRLFYSAYIRLNSLEETEDILHDLFLDLWNNRSKINIKKSLSAYLFTSLKYKIFRLYDYKSVREKHKDKISSEESYSLENNIELDELYDLIEQSVEILPEKCKVVFKLSRFQGLTTKEISEELNISPNTAQNHINKALKILRGKLDKKYFTFFL